MWAQPAVDGGLHPHVQMLLEVDERPAVPNGRHALAVGGTLDGAVDLVADDGQERLDPPRQPSPDDGTPWSYRCGSRRGALDRRRHDACRPSALTSAASSPAPTRR